MPNICRYCGLVLMKSETTVAEYVDVVTLSVYCRANVPDHTHAVKQDHEASDIRDVLEPGETVEIDDKTITLLTGGVEVDRIHVPDGWTAERLRTHLAVVLKNFRDKQDKEEITADNYRQMTVEESDTISRSEMFRRGYSSRMVEEFMATRDASKEQIESGTLTGAVSYPCDNCSHGMDSHRRKNSESWLGCLECTCDVYHYEGSDKAVDQLPPGLSRDKPDVPPETWEINHEHDGDIQVITGQPIINLEAPDPDPVTTEYFLAQQEPVDAIEWVSPIDKVEDDPVNHPSHYTAYPGIEIIQLTRRMGFNRGNAVKYIARAGLKDPSKEIEDLEKAIFYLTDEVKLLKGEYD